MSRSQFTVSVIIPTKNRPVDLVNTVGSLFLQTVKPLELIIVDQTPDEESFLAIHKLYTEAEQDQGQLIYLHEPMIFGASMARNRAMEVATGDVVLFLDDDVILEPDFIEALLETYERYPAAVGVSGIITNYHPPNFVFRAWSWLFARGPFHDERQAIYWQANTKQWTEAVAVKKFGAGLMSFRTPTVEHVRFDPTPCAFPGEDIDFCAQLEPDSLLLISPRARLAHMKTPTARPSEDWLRRKVQVSWYLYKRHWHRSFKNRLCFWWLQLGHGFAAAAISICHFSLNPWLSIFSGVKIARSVEPYSTHDVLSCRRQRSPIS